MTKNGKVDQRVWRMLRREIKKLDGKVAKVGVIGQPAAADRDGITTNAELAAVHEFGSRDGQIPERSFIRATFREQRQRFEEMLGRQAHGIITMKLGAEQALGQLAAFGAGAIKSYITRGSNLLPLAPVTVASKGSSRPLVDTGQLVNSITGAVVQD